MVRGPVRKQSMDPVRSGGPRTGGQSFRVTPFVVIRAVSILVNASRDVSNC